MCKREAGSRGGGTIFSKPKKMSGQTPVLKKYAQMTFKMGQGHLIILKYLHHVTYVS